MPLPFEPELKGGVGFLQNLEINNPWAKFSGGLGSIVVSSEPTSVLETKRSPSPSSASTSWSQMPSNLEIGSTGVEYWDSDLLDPAAQSPSQDQSILRLIMGDVEDPSMGLNKLLNNPDLQFGGLDQGFGLPLSNPQMLSNQIFSSNLGMFAQNPLFQDCPDEKSQVLNHPMVINHQNQNQNQGFFMPMEQQHHHLGLPPPPKRHNPGPFPPQQLHLLPYMQQVQQQQNQTTKPKMAGDEVMIQQQAIVDQLLKAAELIESGNTILAQEILARLNHHHQLSPIGKPFYRAAFYFKEGLRQLLNPMVTSSSSASSPFNLFFKIGAYKSFSEISPLVQFSNFTCNQAVLESLEGFDMIRIVDFDIGYGGQWASLMQELAMRKAGSPSLKITAFASLSTHDQLELSLTRENLTHFAQEINMAFEFEIINIDCLNSSSSWPLESEAIAVNLPITSLSNNLVPPSMILRFVKQLSPKIVVSIDRGFDRNDLPFTHHVHQAFLSYLSLLESLDAVNVSPDALQKIETFLVRPGIEKLISGRHSSLEKTPHWKTQFLTAGFSPVNFSNFTECQAEWLLKRTLARGFHVEKRQASLVLYFQRKELISASAWRCC